MSILSRYVFRQAAGAFALIVLSLSGIVWIALALRELSVVTGKGQSGWVLFQMTTLALPNLMAMIAPFALLIAVMHTLNRLNSDSELIVVTAAGANIAKVAKPLVLLALLVAAGVALVNHLAMPASLRQLREMVLGVRTDLLTQAIQPGRFSSPDSGLTFHIRDRSGAGEVLGLMIHDATKGGATRTYLAERALVAKKGDMAFVVMHNGHVINRKAQGEVSDVIAFGDSIIDLEQFEKKKGDESADLKPRERYFSELMWPEPGSSNYKTNPGLFRSELHERFASPLYPIVFVLVALASIGQAQSTRQNRMESIVAGFLAASLLRLGGLAATNQSTTSEWAVALVYGVPVGAGLIAIFLMSRLARPHASLSITDRALSAAAPLIARFSRLRQKASGLAGRS